MLSHTPIIPHIIITIRCLIVKSICTLFIVCTPATSPMLDCVKLYCVLLIVFVATIEWFRRPDRDNHCIRPSSLRAWGSADRRNPDFHVAKMHSQSDFWRIWWLIQGFKWKEMRMYLLSNVLLLECGRAGLCGGRLFGPSMLRDMIELRLLLFDDNITSSAVMPPIDLVIRLLGPHLCTGVLDVEWFMRGDDGIGCEMDKKSIGSKESVRLYFEQFYFVVGFAFQQFLH